MEYINNLEINSIYDFDDAFSINELLCKFWEKLEDVINVSNECIDILNWLKEEGAPTEIEKIITELVEDGTIERMINVEKIEELRTLINTNKEEITDVREQMDTIAKQTSIYIYPNMTTVEIQILINNNNDITFKKGTYILEKTLNLKNNSIYRFEEGVVLTSNSTIQNIFKSDNNSNITIVGNNVVFELNNKVDNAINIVGSNDDYINNIVISNIKIINRRLTTNKYVSGLTVRYCNNLILNNIIIDDYGYGNVKNNEVYGLGLHWCNKVTVNDLKINNNMIGLLLQACTNVTICNFDIRNTHDNGMYLLTENKNIIVKDGFLTSNEEGIATYSDDMTISNVIFDSCSNKAITLRQGTNYVINNCIFKNNHTDIGDDNDKASKNILITNCIFTDSNEYSIFLRKSSYLKLDNNIFNHNKTLNELIRFADKTDKDSNDITISNNAFNLNSNVTYAIRFVPWNGGCMRLLVSCNRFNNCNTAISIYKGSGATGGDNPYLLKNIFNGVSYPTSISGSVSNEKNEDWL